MFARSSVLRLLLMYGIPNMKLDKMTVQRRIDLMAAEGIDFVFNTEIGTDIPGKKLMEDFDAIVLCIGALKPRDLPVEGRDLKGVYQAIEFLEANTRSLLDSKHGDGNYISAKDKDVVVLGQGDTGTDCLGTSMRHGCKSLNQFDIIPAPPEARTDGNPWPEMPRILKIDYGHEEVAARFGGDPRTYKLSTFKFSDDGNGNVKELHTREVEWEPQEDGRPFREVEGTEKAWPADIVLLSMGWLGPEDTLLDEFDLERDARSNAKAEVGQYTTEVEGLFVAGDVRRGMSLVVWAFKEGREAAHEVDRYLMGSTDLP